LLSNLTSGVQMTSNIIANYYHTIKYLKFIQIYGQLRYRFIKSKIPSALFPKQCKIKSTLIQPILKLAEMRDANTILLLNREQDISSQGIWSEPKLDALWLYHLHYFDVLNAADLSCDRTWCYLLLKRWINENPPSLGSGWESYTLSLRIVNWIKWLYVGHVAEPDILHSLATQVRYLFTRLEIHLLGNHLLANAKALIYAGLFFVGHEANQWLRKGLALFTREMAEQILADGGHFELSPMYHSIILEDLLDIINLFKTHKKPIPDAWLNIYEKMLYWLENMCHLDNEIAFFNDAALGVAPTLQELKKYAKRLNLNLKPLPTPSFVHLASSGYCRIQHQGVLLLTDIAEIRAPYQPGHAHADSLSFELSIQQQRVIVNSGTSTYAESDERLRQRGSKAHNTVVIDDQNSSQIWKSFRVARRAKIHDIEINQADHTFMIRASHDGYYRLDKIIHTRTWSVSNHLLLIHDRLSGKGQHKIELIFHIHPDIKLEQTDHNSIVFYDQKDMEIATLQTHHAIKVSDSTYHPYFNVSLPNKKLIIEIIQELPVQFNTFITWN